MEQRSADNSILRRSRYTAVFLGLLIALAALVVWNINTGSVHIGVGEIARILFTGKGDDTAVGIVWKLRLPRIAAAAVLGGGLALSGFLMQTFFGNPIAGPFVLGISSGSKLFVALTMIVALRFVSFISSWMMVVAAFVGALIAMGFVLLAAKAIRQMSMLLVAGIMISYICSAVTDLLINFANEADIVNLTHWSMGSFSAASWQDVRISAWIIAPVFLFVLLASKPMSAYALGEGYAQSLGVHIRGLRILMVLTTGLLSACVAAFAGPVSFVGIAVPHISRSLLRTGKPILMIPASFLCGAVFCVLCDLAARTLFAPVELSISTVTSAVGAPIVIWLMLSRRRKHED